MPVYQVYFPDEIASEIQRITDRDKITTKEFIQSAVGRALSDAKGNKGK
jgi:hypothetical protein